MNSKRYDGYLYDGPYVETIKEIVENTVTKYPDEVAYMYKDVHGEPFKEFTYGDFDLFRISLGTALLDMGLKGSKIAVIGENSHRWALTYFTVVTGVGVIVPIDKNLERDEIVNLLLRADVEMIFASPKMFKKVGSAIDEVIDLKYMAIMDTPKDDPEAFKKDHRIVMMSDLLARGEELIAEGRRDYIDAEVKPEDLSTILFTSGTTGLAKGVMLSHMNLAQNVFNMSKFYQAPKGGRILDVLPMHHAYEMTCTIITGVYQAKTIVICEGLKYIQANFLEAGCCTMLGVPLIFENIHRKIWNQAAKTGQTETLRRALNLSKNMGFKNNKFITKRMFKSMHMLFGPNFYEFIVGGSAIDPKVIVEFELMGMPMMQGYGMTENSPIIAMNADRYGKAASAGKPMPGTDVRIVDKDETGVGEIICKGPSVMMGYYKDPESTAETIRDGWLHTGDYGYFDEDGFLFITGRKKNVIVTKGGKNIFPEEVEYYLLLEQFISEVIVYGKPDNSVKDDLVCTAIIYPDFKMLGNKGYKTDKQIYEALKASVEKANAKMPPYKRVKRIEVRDTDFIKTTTMKIKRFEEENYEYKFDDRTFNS